MAKALTPAEEEPAAEEETEAVSLVAPRARKAGVFRRRFRLVYAALGLVVGAAAAGAVVLVVEPGKTSGPAWSLWEPQGEPVQRAQQIADYVGSAYLLESGNQLVGVQVAQAEDIEIGAIAVRATTSVVGAPIRLFPVDDSVVYILCGPGQDCAIQEGTPSSERLRLLRREALELALYTFRYVDGKDIVVTFLPPRLGERPTYALFFERGEFESQLEQPLRATLPNPTPPLPEGIPAAEVATIDALTEPIFFRFSFRTLEDGTPVLLLDDPDDPLEEDQAQSETTPSEPAPSETTSQPGEISAQ